MRLKDFTILDDFEQETLMIEAMMGWLKTVANIESVLSHKAMEVIEYGFDWTVTETGILINFLDMPGLFALSKSEQFHLLELASQFEQFTNTYFGK